MKIIKKITGSCNKIQYKLLKKLAETRYKTASMLYYDNTCKRIQDSCRRKIDYANSCLLEIDEAEEDEIMEEKYKDLNLIQIRDRRGFPFADPEDILSVDKDDIFIKEGDYPKKVIEIREKEEDGKEYLLLKTKYSGIYKVSLT